MSDYKKSETRQILEEIYSGKYPVRGSDGREYYVRYNDSKEELEEVPPPELRPLTEEDKAAALWLASGLRPQGIGAWEIAGEGLKGFGQGVVSGLGRVSGGATLGATDWLDRKTGGHLASLDADLQRSAESSGLGGWNKAAKFASELGGNMLYLSKAEVTKMPGMMKSMPSETTEYGQHIYTSQTPSGEMRLVTKPVGKDRVVSSMYINNR